MKKALLILLGLLMALGCGLCGCSGDPEQPGESSQDQSEQKEGVSLFIDRNFKQGLAVQGTNIQETGGDYIGYFELGGKAERPEGTEPVWFVSQFASRYNILEGNYQEVSPGRHQYSDESKTFVADTNTGEFVMGIKGSKEYDAPRQETQSLAGLLLTPNRVEEVMLSELEQVVFELDFTINSVENCMSDEEYNEMLHTAQFLFYFFVHDDVTGQWFFCGVPMYDYRHIYQSEWKAQDNPNLAETTGQFVYVPATKDCYEDPILVGEKMSIRVNMLPFIYKGFDYAQEAGYMQLSSKENLVIKGCNIGWEIPGTFDCMATVSHYDVRLVSKV